MFYFITHCKIYNYADDNTVWHRELNTVKEILEKEVFTLLEWFESNQMQADPDTVQTVSAGRKTFEQVKQFTIQLTLE